MNENRNVKTEKNSIGGKYFHVGLTAFCVFAALLLLFFFIFKIKVIGALIGELISILRPILVGLVIAYLLVPIANFLEKYLKRFFVGACKFKKHGNGLARGFSITFSLIFFFVIIGLLIWLIVPQVIDSVTSIAKDLPGQVQGVVNWLTTQFTENNFFASVADALIKFINNWAEQDMLATVTTWAGQIATGIVKTAYFLWDFFIGLMVMIYVLASREKFAAQGKKALFAIFKTKLADKVIEVTKTANYVFSSFISGKLLDSAIIGVLCFIGVSILGMPYPVLLAVIVGVTNVIPVFGPYIGAVPCTLIVFMRSPIQALYFLIFIIALQAFDGNILGPKILGDSTGLSPFWVVFAIVLGGGLFGVTGMIVGVPTFAVIYFLVEEWISARLTLKNMPTSTASYMKSKEEEKVKNEQEGTNQ